MEPTIKIGKAGVDAVVGEVKLQLKKRPEIKVKVNQSLISGRMKEYTKKIGQKLAEKTDSHLSMVRGRTLILRRNKNVDRTTKD